MDRRKFTGFLALPIAVLAFSSIGHGQTAGGGAEPIHSGFVFYEGAYVTGPYVVGSDEWSVCVNAIPVVRYSQQVPDLAVPEDPGFPEGLTSDATLDDLRELKWKNRMPYYTAKLVYLWKRYPREEAQERMLDYYRSLPCIREVARVAGDGVRLTDHRGNSRIVDLYIPEWVMQQAPAGVSADMDALVEMYRNRLERGDCFFFFEDGTEIAITGRKAGSVLPGMEAILADRSRDNSSKVRELLDLGIVPEHDEGLAGRIVSGFAQHRELRERWSAVTDVAPGNRGTSAPGAPESESAESLSRGYAADAAYSPDGTFLYVYAPCEWDGRSRAAEYQAVAGYITEQDYDVTTVIRRDLTSHDDDCGSCSLQHFRNCKDAGFLYVTTHSNAGMLVGIYMKTEAAVDLWRGTEPLVQTRESSVILWEGSPAYYAWVPGSWYPMRWKATLDQSKAIVVLAGCETAVNLISQVVSASGGGVCFGYTGYPTPYHFNYNNTILLRRMNGSAGGGSMRTAGEAFDGGAGYLSGFSMYGDPALTLCPAYLRKFPLGRSPRQGTGFFEVDTYCHDEVDPGDVLTFQTNGRVTVGNVRWVGSGQVRRIEFDWSGFGPWKVRVTAHADKFHSWGASTSGYHRMDGNRVAPNGDDVTWVFSYSPFHRLPEFIGPQSPNPFRRGGEISYSLPAECHVKLEIFDTLGRRVATLVDEHQQPGSMSVFWNALDGQSVLPCGVYFCRLKAGSRGETSKIVLTR